MSNRIDLTQFEARTKGPWAVLRHEDHPEEEAPANKHLVCISSQYGIDEKDQPHWDSLSVAFIDNRWAEDMAEWNTRLEYSATRGTSREMLDANAKAIAAVPDLLAELKRCYEKIDWLQQVADLAADNIGRKNWDGFEEAMYEAGLWERPSE
jgi:hypothetical protein